MESYPEASVPVGGVLQADHLPLPILKAASFHGDSSGSGLTEVLLDQYTEVDVSSEWLSTFVEECLSSAGSCLMPAKDHQNETTTTTTTTTNPTPSKTPQFKPNKNKSPTHGKLAFPAKPRSQRKRKVVTTPKTHQNPLTKWSNQLKQRTHTLQSPFCDPPLLEQTYWLADSELLTMPRKEEEEEERKGEEEIVVGMDEKMEEVEKENSQGQQEQQQQPRRCTHCQAQKTPQWRAGPMGPKTLCNACGMRYFKSGRLLPEYRPAKSPTFVSYKHSNSHKKVLQMRMSVLSSSTMQQ